MRGSIMVRLVFAAGVSCFAGVALAAAVDKERLSCPPPLKLSPVPICDVLGQCWYECLTTGGNITSVKPDLIDPPDGPDDPDEGKVNKGNHYGNDKPDGNANDSKNKHDGEQSASDHHDNNGKPKKK